MSGRNMYQYKFIYIKTKNVLHKKVNYFKFCKKKLPLIKRIIFFKTMVFI